MSQQARDDRTSWGEAKAVAPPQQGMIKEGAHALQETASAALGDLGDMVTSMGEVQLGPNPYSKESTPEDLLQVIKDKVAILVARWQDEGATGDELLEKRRALALEYMELTDHGVDMFHVVSADAMWGETSSTAKLCRMVQSSWQNRLSGLLITTFLLSEYIQAGEINEVAVGLDFVCLGYISAVSGLNRFFSSSALGFYWVRGFLFDDIILMMVWVAFMLSFWSRDYTTWELDKRYHFVGYFRALLILSKSPRCLVAGELFIGDRITPF